MCDKDQSQESVKKFSIFAFLFVILALLLTWYLLEGRLDRGTFGDMFGVTDAFFSGLAFVGIIYTIWLQRKELELQRKELKSTREELKGQKLQLKAQNATLKKRNFENTFFELLRLQNSITNSIDLFNVDGHRTTKGRDCFRVFYDRLRTYWQRNIRDSQGDSEPNGINKTYLQFYNRHQHEIGHYFRSLYNIVKFVDRSPVEDKKFYTNLLRAQLSSFELALLFYNSLSDKGNKKFKPLIEEYSILKTVPREELLNPDHYHLYSEKAYSILRGGTAII